MEIRLTVTVNDTVTVVHADGRLNRLGAAELDAVVRMTSGPVTLDLTNLMSADDAGVAVLRSFSDKGIRLVGVSPYMALLLKSDRPRDPLTWRQRYQLRDVVLSSLWVVPVGAIVVGLPFSMAARAVDEATRWRLLDYGPEGARALTAALASSTLTFIVFLFSALLVALQVASAQLSPRIIARGLRNRPTRFCLGLFVFTFLFGVAVLGRLESSVGQLRLFLVVLLNLASIAAFLYLVAYLGDYLRPISVLTGVGRDGAAVIEQVYPRQLSDPEVPVRASAVPPSGPPALVVEHTGDSGVVRAFDVSGLTALARQSDSLIELVPQVGDFVAKGDPLFRVYGTPARLEPRSLRESVALGPERTIEQDPAFALRIIVDIGAKALSPAINDATTAVLAIDQLHHLLRKLGMRRLHTGVVRDRDGQLRLRYRTPDWEDFVWLAVTELRHHGAGQIQVMRRLRAMLESLVAGLPRERSVALETELALVARTAMRSFVEPEDQARASQPDSLGVGGHGQEASG